MELRPRLSRELAASTAFADRHDVDVLSARAPRPPEKVVQFGTGGFLRGFAEYFVDEANRAGRFNGSIVAVSSTGSSRNEALNAQDGLFTLAIRGIEHGSPQQRYRVVSSLSRALSARDEWSDVLQLARAPLLELVISNTTEVGIIFDEDDQYAADPPRSYPGKLTRFLAERAAAFDYDDRRGLTVVPCELIEDNGTRLGEIVRRLARIWQLDARFTTWLDRSVVFCNTLVDRIVPGALPADDLPAVERTLGYRDALLTVCEPYALFAIEGGDALRPRLPFVDRATPERVIVAADIGPYRLRKVRVLNGGHTIAVSVALLAGLETVREAVTDERVGRFIRRVVFDEIVPSVDAPGVEAFADEVMERFANPFIRHALIDITLHHTAKMRVRVVPSVVGYQARTGRVPAALAFGFAAYIMLLRGALQSERIAIGLPVPADAEGARVRDAWHAIDVGSDAALAALARVVCSDASLWGRSLATVPGFVEAVGEGLVRIVRHGVLAALGAQLTESATI